MRLPPHGSGTVSAGPLQVETVPFIPRSEHELDALDDEALVAHIVAAREAGDWAQASLALRILVFGFWDNVVRQVRVKLRGVDAEAIASEVMLSAIRSAFDGSSVGQFRSWLNTITSRRIADYHRKREAEPQMVALAVGDGAERGEQVVGASGQYEEVELTDVLERELSKLNPLHARAVELYLLQGYPARTVAEELDLTQDNVAQIASRFRRRLRAQLEPDMNA